GLEINGNGIEVGDIGELRAAKDAKFELEVHTVPELGRRAGEDVVDVAHLRGVDGEADALAAYLHNNLRFSIYDLRGREMSGIQGVLVNSMTSFRSPFRRSFEHLIANSQSLIADGNDGKF